MAHGKPETCGVRRLAAALPAKAPVGTAKSMPLRTPTAGVGNRHPAAPTRRAGAILRRRKHACEGGSCRAEASGAGGFYSTMKNK
jgi:hypothetical protein